MRAFTKISAHPIGDRSASIRAQFVIYLDETLLEEGWESELSEGGLMLLNTRRQVDDPRIVAVDADGISAEVLGRPIPNTAFLGAIAALTDAVGIDDVHEGIRATMPAKLVDKNLAIADAAYRKLVNREIAEVRAFVESARPADEVTQSLAEKDALFALAAEILVEGDALAEGEERSSNGRDF